MMNNCLECKADTKNPKFCSRTCSVTHSNRGRSKKLKECANCGDNTRNPKYCGSACQHTHQRRTRVELWLKTGNCNCASYKSHYVKEYIFEEQKHWCAICKNDIYWQGKTLSLILDHIDGDHTNNCRENLRLVCPNCDSQLPTYKSRNKGNGRHSRRVRYAEGKSY